MKRTTYVTCEDGKTAIKCRNRTVYMGLWRWCRENLQSGVWDCYAQHEFDSYKDYTILISTAQ